MLLGFLHVPKKCLCIWITSAAFTAETKDWELSGGRHSADPGSANTASEEDAEDLVVKIWGAGLESVPRFPQHAARPPLLPAAVGDAG